MAARVYQGTGYTQLGHVDGDCSEAEFAAAALLLL